MLYPQQLSAVKADIARKDQELSASQALAAERKTELDVATRRYDDAADQLTRSDEQVAALRTQLLEVSGAVNDIIIIIIIIIIVRVSTHSHAAVLTYRQNNESPHCSKTLRRGHPRSLMN